MGQSQGEDIIVQSYNGENNTWDVIEEPDRGPYDVPISATSNNDMVYILGGQAPTENRLIRVDDINQHYFTEFAEKSFMKSLSLDSSSGL